VEKVYDIVGLYLNPPEAGVVYCVDEKSQAPSLGTVPTSAGDNGMPEKCTHDDVRHGTTGLFAAFNTGPRAPSSPASTGATGPSRCAKFLNKIDAQVPAGLEVHLIADNHSTHKSPTIVG
jgi:hypothetical protein